MVIVTDIMELIFDELNRRWVYKYETYAPLYVCSAMMHSFNLMNQKRQIYWEGSRLPNMRMHLLFVAPPGFMKTHYLSTMGGDRFAIFKNAGVHVGHEQSLTEAGFIGTIRNVSGVDIIVEGAAQTYANGLMLIDEFSAITSALKVQYNAQMDTQLLAALDHGNVFKRLGGGKIAYQTHLTLWAGVQPARYDLSSGMGRRLGFLLFLPTKYDNDQLRYHMHKARGVRPDENVMNKIWGLLEKNIKNMDIVETVTYGESVYQKYGDMELFSYESSYFDKLLLGWHLMTYGPEKHIVIEAGDELLDKLIGSQKKWRNEIVSGVDYVQVMKLIKVGGIQVAEGFEITLPDLVTQGIMVGWNAHQIHEKIMEMSRQRMVSMKGSVITLLTSSTSVNL